MFTFSNYLVNTESENEIAPPRRYLVKNTNVRDAAPFLFLNVAGQATIALMQYNKSASNFRIR